LLGGLAERGELIVVGAVYSLDTGKVAWLPQSRSGTAARLGAFSQSMRCAASRQRMFK